MTGAPGNAWPGAAAAGHGRSHRGPALESRVRGVPALRSAVAFAVSFEVVFVLFLFAGRFKADPRFAWIPIDLTVLFFGLSVMYGVGILVLRGPRLPRRPAMVAVWGLLFAAYASFTLLWAPPEPFPLQKVLQFYTLCLWSLAGAALVIAAERRRVARFGLALLLMAAWVGYEAYLAYTQTSGLVQINAMGSGYLGMGRTVGAGMLVCVCAILFGRALWVRLACAAAFGAFGFVLLVLGGRGPLVSAVAGALVPIFTSLSLSRAGLPRLNRRILLLVALLTIGVAWTYRYMAAGGKTATLARFAVLLEAGRGKSATERLEYHSLASSLWQERPVTGHGFGSWSALVGSPIAGDHPHNIVLEIAVELGVVGLLVFAALLVSCWIAFRSPVPLRADPVRTLALMLVVNAAVNAQFSGNLLDNRTLFAFLGLLCTPAVAQAAQTRRRSAAGGPNWPSPSQPGLHSAAGSVL